MMRRILKAPAARVLLTLIVTTALHAGQRLPLSDDERQWLADVAPIMTVAERRTFKQKMTTHEARADFIALFWAKRDPDTTTRVNEFEEAYWDRLAYAREHFDENDARIPSMSMFQLYVLLGEPDTKHYRLDHVMFSTSRRFFRRAYAYHPPELWTYEEPGYGFARTELKVQFIATSSFGDYVALTDSFYTEHYLDTLKKKFIVNPEAELIPVTGKNMRLL